MPLSKINSNSFSSTANTSVDNGTFNIDVTNNRVGINRSNPNVGFEVANSSWRLATYSGAGAYDGGLGGGFNPNNSIYSMYCRDRTDSYWNTLWIEANTILLKSGNGAFTAVQCDASGRVTKPYQPSFMAVVPTEKTLTGGVENLLDNHFTSATFNIGGHYNTSNGRFTAPVAGLYLFTLDCYVYSCSTVEFYCRINGSNYIRFWDKPQGINANPSGNRVTWTLYLSANDYITMAANPNQTAALWNGGPYSSRFHGTLLG